MFALTPLFNPSALPSSYSTPAGPPSTSVMPSSILSRNSSSNSAMVFFPPGVVVVEAAVADRLAVLLLSLLSFFSLPPGEAVAAFVNTDAGVRAWSFCLYLAMRTCIVSVVRCRFAFAGRGTWTWAWTTRMSGRGADSKIRCMVIDKLFGWIGLIMLTTKKKLNCMKLNIMSGTATPLILELQAE